MKKFQNSVQNELAAIIHVLDEERSFLSGLSTKTLLTLMQK